MGGEREEEEEEEEEEVHPEGRQIKGRKEKIKREKEKCPEAICWETTSLSVGIPRRKRGKGGAGGREIRSVSGEGSHWTLRLHHCGPEAALDL